MSTNEMTGGEALARMIRAFRGGPMFGMGGFQLLPFYDAARRLGLSHHLINDERAGVFAADAYAKVSGRVGLADATLGPGATNLVTGLVEALNAGSPLVVLTGNTHRAHSWKKHDAGVAPDRDSSAGRKGPHPHGDGRAHPRVDAPRLRGRDHRPAPARVVVDVPEDICHATFPFEEGAFRANPAHEAAPALRCRPDAGDVDRAAAMIADAQRPLILAGGGVHLAAPPRG
jgi:acetolactate synthase-1/2/3 large subunit